MKINVPGLSIKRIETVDFNSWKSSQQKRVSDNMNDSDIINTNLSKMGFSDRNT